MNIAETETRGTPRTIDPAARKLERIRNLLAEDRHSPDAVLDAIAAVLAERGPIYQKSWG